MPRESILWEQQVLNRHRVGLTSHRQSGGEDRCKKLQPGPNLSWTRWTLFELFVVFTFAGVAAACASSGRGLLGVCLFAIVLCLRIATVDYSIAGTVATGLAVALGIPTVFLALWWAVGG